MYPNQVPVDEKSIQRLITTLETSYKSIVGEIATATDFGVANRKAILAQIHAELTKLGVDVQKFIETEVSGMYKAGANDAVRQLKNVGADVNVANGFNRVHQEAIKMLVDDTSKAFGESMTGVDRSAQLLLGRVSRQTITQKLAEGMIGGKARAEINKIIKGTLQEQGLDALIDKAGHSWSLDRYADMLFRTKAVEARNRGLLNRMVENEYDLVQVSAHGATDVCADWEGQILSITGETPGYQTVSDAEADGLFHPNCKHAINAVIPSLAKLTNAYDPDEETIVIDQTGKSSRQLIGKPGTSLLPAYEKIAERELLTPAREWKAAFDAKLEATAKEAGMEYKPGPVKEAPRTAEKIVYDYNGNVFGMKDINRSVFFIEDPADQKTFNNLVSIVENNFNQLEPKDIKRGLEVKDSYASNKLSVITPYGAKAEIQITTKEMWRAKIDLGGDDLYGIWRDPNTDPGKVQSAYDDMRKLYTEASEATAKRLGQ